MNRNRAPLTGDEALLTSEALARKDDGALAQLLSCAIARQENIADPALFAKHAAQQLMLANPAKLLAHRDGHLACFIPELSRMLNNALNKAFAQHRVPADPEEIEHACRRAPIPPAAIENAPEIFIKTIDGKPEYQAALHQSAIGQCAMRHRLDLLQEQDLTPKQRDAILIFTL